MKFHQLAIGARFRFKGALHTKISPVMASDAAGKQVFMKRSDEVMAAESAVHGEGPGPNRRQQALSGALSDYTRRAMEIIQRNFHPADHESLQRLHAQLRELEQDILAGRLEELD